MAIGKAGRRRLGTETAMPAGMLRQVAALPYRLDSHGELEILFVTSRGKNRLILPKGWPIDGLRDHEAAAVEADEEAGVEGDIDPRAIGSMTYSKAMGNRRLPVTASIFALRVHRVKPWWKEATCRERHWISPSNTHFPIYGQGLDGLLAALLSSIDGNPDTRETESSWPAFRLPRLIEARPRHGSSPP